jgi:5-methylcytosine-specific restriction endonuclease McrA
MIDWPVKFVESKYSRWYNLLIQAAQLRGTVIGYKEVHHIIPRSVGGSNEFLVMGCKQV